MYYVQIDGQTRGPYILDQIRNMWAAGIITADAMYREEDGAPWKPALELFSGETESLPTPEKASEVVRPEESPAPSPDAWDSRKPRPWRRLWARFLDFQILGGIPASLLAPIWLYFFPHFAGIAGLGIAIAGANEPLCLVYFGNTPGKWLLGILLQKSDGNTLSQKEASRRFWAVAWRSIIPVFPFCAALAYRDLKKRGSTKWDRKGGYIVTYRPISESRWFASLSLVAVFIAAYWIAFSQLIAPDTEQASTVSQLIPASKENAEQMASPEQQTVQEQRQQFLAQAVDRYPSMKDTSSTQYLLARSLAAAAAQAAPGTQEYEDSRALDAPLRFAREAAEQLGIKPAGASPNPDNSPTPAFPPRDSAEWQSRNNSAKANVIANYPDVAIAGTPLNTEFVREYNDCKATDPAFLDDPDFPLAIIERLKKRRPDLVNAIPGLAVAPSAPSTAPVQAAPRPFQVPADPPVIVRAPDSSPEPLYRQPPSAYFHHRFSDNAIEARYTEIAREMAEQGIDPTNAKVMEFLQPEIDAQHR